MARPLSSDLRERVVAAVMNGDSRRMVATRFGVAVSSVVKWSQRHRATGSVQPAKMGGYRKRVLEPHRAFIVERLSQQSHLTAWFEGGSGGSRHGSLRQYDLGVHPTRGAALSREIAVMLTLKHVVVRPTD